MTISTPQTETIHIELGPRSYPIHIGAGLVREAGSVLAAHLASRPNVYVLCDEAIWDETAPVLEDALYRGGAGHIEKFRLLRGEGSKTWGRLQEVTNWLLEQGADRKSVVVALGGGVTGDLAGFAAAVYMRGIPFIQVPSTLLAQVDSSVGGKTGINTDQGKNLIGAFHQPQSVLIDLDLLDSLPDRELRAGYAEAQKYALIGDPELFAWLEDGNAGKILARDRAALTHIIRECCLAKARVVQEDEREGGVRALLNLGHTFGHALEAAAGFDSEALLHGEAVAAGCGLAFDLSAELGLCPREDAQKVADHLRRAGLPASISDIPAVKDVPASTFLSHMRKDKKNADGRIRLVLVRGIGDAFIADDIPEDKIHDALVRSLESK